jgi:uncharacterized protein (TIGR03000 family)
MPYPVPVYHGARAERSVSDAQEVASQAAERRRSLLDTSPGQSVVTSLVLHVPEGADVELAGSKTTTKGTVRTYTTTGLDTGQSIPGYTVRVSVHREGRVETKEQTIQLVGGRDVEMTFQFDDAQLADAR